MPKSPSAGAPVRAEPDVVGLDVAVDDAERVHVVERVGQLGADAQHLGDRQPPLGRAARALGQRAAGHVPRDDQDAPSSSIAS